jgi:hypothetical protein
VLQFEIQTWQSYGDAPRKVKTGAEKIAAHHASPTFASVLAPVKRSAQFSNPLQSTTR